MSNLLSHEQIEDLLDYIGAEKVGIWKGDKINFCCPIHGESHPSCGINADFTPEDSLTPIQVFNCFSCHTSGTLPWFLHLSLPDDFPTLGSAIKFMSERYEIAFEVTQLDKYNLKKYEEMLGTAKERFELPMSSIAGYRGGKETYSYFYKRGFTKHTVKEFCIGRDIENKTVTVPVFWEDGVLAGVIGRYIDEKRPHNERFKIYDFPKSNLLFPLDHFYTENGEIILVEGLFDAIRMHELGYHNTLTTFTSSVSNQQARMLKSLGRTVIDVFDNDDMGRAGVPKIKRKLRGMTWLSVDFPEYGKDPCDWGDSDIDLMISSKRLLSTKLKRL